MEDHKREATDSKSQRRSVAEATYKWEMEIRQA